MHAASFAEVNTILGPPDGVSEDQVRSLGCYIGKDSGETLVVVSCWKLTHEELKEINETGRIWLTVCGPTMPAVHLQTATPFPGDKA